MGSIKQAGSVHRERGPLARIWGCGANGIGDAGGPPAVPVPSDRTFELQPHGALASYGMWLAVGGVGL